MKGRGLTMELYYDVQYLSTLISTYIYYREMVGTPCLI